MDRVAVVIPTRNRPHKLERCLDALAAARGHVDFLAYVADSSTSAEARARVRQVCECFPFVRLRPHELAGVAAARNFCAQVAEAELLVNVDDDVYVEPESVARLVRRYEATSGWRAVAGSVAWGDDWSTPVRMRWIGYARSVEEGESPSFLIGAFFAYPRSLALALPWHEAIPSSDDRFMGAVWRSKGVSLLFEPDARAHHDPQQNMYGVEHQESHIYTNLFDAVIANRSLRHLVAYEVLGFAAGAKTYCRNMRTAREYVAAWYRGHRAFVRNRRALRALATKPLPPFSGS